MAYRTQLPDTHRLLPRRASKCGDGKCNAPTETCANCPVDCGKCEPVCGNGKCEAGETCSNCAGER